VTAESNRDKHPYRLRAPIRAAATLLGISIGVYLIAAGLLYALSHAESYAAIVVQDLPSTAAAAAATLEASGRKALSRI